MAPSENGWNEYSRLVLEQLETLSVGIDSLRDELQEIKQEMTLMKAREDRVVELKAWKDRIDEVASPPQLKSMFDQLEDLKEFKTKAITIFLVVQALTGFILAYTHVI
tara:strand:- start:222 stop:545 length:324 start_codon:yes stop_codon:yes gene_type:complete